MGGWVLWPAEAFCLICHSGRGGVSAGPGIS